MTAASSRDAHSGTLRMTQDFHMQKRLSAKRDDHSWDRVTDSPLRGALQWRAMCLTSIESWKGMDRKFA
jgi:hypothetical protein